MITLPFLLKQSTPSGCLPTTVRAVLLWTLCEESPDDCAESLVSQREITLLCHQDETVFGCDWDIALSELAQTYNVEDLTGNEDEIRGVFQNAQEAQPVIVILGDSSGSTTGTHAVAILNVAANAQEDGGETIVFYDPESGDIREMSGRDFWSAWSLGGEYAFTIQP